ncbi:MAG TPA: response regulator [Candidatus Saccharimonadales bacterium]|nr:response regulator [Candidatus Saccharimonadales bacterium]
MSKIMLVEDDNNLREIYQARLNSEGYDTVTASDGEEALSIVGKEKPDLIILDVMMPKISGFDTLDLLKNSPVTKDIKVIMMTALSQAEDRARAQKLGAQNYLVKSQVTLEDIVKAIKDALDGNSVYPSSDVPDATVSTAPAPSVFNTSTPVDEPVTNPIASPAQTSSATDETSTISTSPDPVSMTPTPAPSTDDPVTNVSINHVDEPVATPEIETAVTSSPEITTPSVDPLTPVSDPISPNSNPEPVNIQSNLTTPSTTGSPSMPMDSMAQPTDPTPISPVETPINLANDVSVDHAEEPTNIPDNTVPSGVPSDDSTSPTEPINFNTPA